MPMLWESSRRVREARLKKAENAKKYTEGGGILPGRCSDPPRRVFIVPFDLRFLVLSSNSQLPRLPSCRTESLPVSYLPIYFCGPRLLTRPATDDLSLPKGMSFLQSMLPVLRGEDEYRCFGVCPGCTGYLVIWLYPISVS